MSSKRLITRLSFFVITCPCWSMLRQSRSHLAKVQPTGSVARRSFQELLSARDKQVTESLKSANAFVCFRQDKDEFLIASFSKPSTWTQDEKTPALEVGYEIVSFDDYLNGATALHGVGLSLPFGKWTRAKGNEQYSSFEGTSRKAGQTYDDKGFTIEIDNDEVTVQETYENAAGGTTQYSFNVRRSTGRFTENFTVIPTFGAHETSTSEGHCSLYSAGRLVH